MRFADLDLKPHQLRIKGVPASVRNVEIDRQPRRIVLLIDASVNQGPGAITAGQLPFL
jgi:hypothetical protein